MQAQLFRLKCFENTIIYANKTESMCGIISFKDRSIFEASSGVRYSTIKLAQDDQYEVTQ